MMKKIAFISTVNYEPWAGCEELWSRAAMVLARSGVVVEASVCHEPAATTKLTALESAGCKIHRRNRPRPLRERIPRRLWRKIARKPWTMEDKSEYRWVHTWLSSFRPDLV